MCIDDWELDSLPMLKHFLKIWADPYGRLAGEVKGGQIPLNYRALIITSNYSLDQCLDHMNADAELRAALKGRFRETVLSETPFLLNHLR